MMYLRKIKMTVDVYSLGSVGKGKKMMRFSSTFYLLKIVEYVFVEYYNTIYTSFLWYEKE